MRWLGDCRTWESSARSIWLSMDRTQRLDWLRECRRLRRSIRLQRKLAGDGLAAGVDEAGRGPLAGPVVAAAVILPPGCIIIGLDDSKKLTSRTREHLLGDIYRRAVALGVGFRSAECIDRTGIKPATFSAMTDAVRRLLISPDTVLVDGKDDIPGLQINQRSVVRGDERFTSVAAASVVAKEVRDRFMRARHDLYPQYDFTNNKGYATRKHRRALRRFGPCVLHRRSFSPLNLRQIDLFKKQVSSTAEPEQ